MMISCLPETKWHVHIQENINTNKKQKTNNKKSYLYHLLRRFVSELAGAASLRNGCFNSSFAVARWAGFRTSTCPRKSNSKWEAWWKEEEEEVSIKNSYVRRREVTITELCIKGCGVQIMGRRVWVWEWWWGRRKRRRRESVSMRLVRR